MPRRAATPAPLPHVGVPRVALVGRPNVGKSTLFNLLSRGGKAVVHATAGTTRDARLVPAALFGHVFNLIDTAGIEPGKTATDLQASLHTKARAAMAQAEIILLLIDGAVGLTPADRALIADVRKLNKPTVVVLNKTDLAGAEDHLADLENLGFLAVVPMATAHRAGLDDLHAALAPLLPAAPAETEAKPDTFDTEDNTAELEEELDAPLDEKAPPYQLPPVIRLAILGRPNVGKSTLTNTLLHEDRQLTGPTAGLTRDAVAHLFSRSGQQYEVVDTPGLRKKTNVVDDLEGLSVAQALTAADHADVIILLVDVSTYNQSTGNWVVFEQQDAKIADAMLAKGKPIIVALNKYEMIAGAAEKAACLADVAAQLKARLHSITSPVALPISAAKNKGIDKLLAAVNDVLLTSHTRVGTAKLNRTLAKILAKRSPPLAQGHSVNIKYITQTATNPPRFALFGTRVHLLAEHYQSFVRHQLAAALGLTTVPITLTFKRTANPFAGRRRKAEG